MRRRTIRIGLALFLVGSVASAGAVGSNRSVSDLAEFVTLQGFRLHADHCSARFPGLKPRFDGLMEGLGDHVNEVSKGLLSLDAFKGMKDKPVPAEIEFAFQDSLEDARRNVERRDAESACQKALRDMGGMDDDSLKALLTQTLVALQNMTRNLEKESARQAPPASRVLPGQ